MRRNPSASGRRRPAATSFWLVVFLAVLLAGCGGEDPSPEPTTTPPDTQTGATGVAIATPATAAPDAEQAAVTQSPVAEAGVIVPATASITAPLTATASTTITPCVQPVGWFVYKIQPGDTLTALAARSDATVDALSSANCTDEIIVAGQTLWLPVDLRLTPTPCPRPGGWVAYTVAANDTLSLLAGLTGATVEEIQQANCLPDTIIVEGHALYLPSTPVRRVTATPVTALASAPVAAPVEQPAAGGFLAPLAGEEDEPSDEGSAQHKVNPGIHGSPLPRITIVWGPPLEPGDPSTGQDSCTLDGDSSFRVVAYNPPGETTNTEIGKRKLFFACNPSGTAGLMTATVTFDWNGAPQIRELPLYTRPPRQDIARRNPHPTAIWYSVPGLPTDVPYQIMIRDSAGNETAPLQFVVKPPTRQRVLVVPAVGYAGATEFKLYLVNYLPGLYDVEIRGTDNADNPFDCIENQTFARDPIQVSVGSPSGGADWGFHPFVSEAADLPGCYAFQEKSTGAESIFVLLP